MPMHMCFLGIEKSLISLTSMLANRTDMEWKYLGTANWQSDCYLEFSGVSLFHISPLDNGDITNHLGKQLILSFKSMRVTWFCFISHIFAEEKVPTETINVLARLLLSSCRRFWILEELRTMQINEQMGILPPRKECQEKR